MAEGVIICVAGRIWVVVQVLEDAINTLSGWVEGQTPHHADR